MFLPFLPSPLAPLHSRYPSVSLFFPFVIPLLALPLTLFLIFDILFLILLYLTRPSLSSLSNCLLAVSIYQPFLLLFLTSLPPDGDLVKEIRDQRSAQRLSRIRDQELRDHDCLNLMSWSLPKSNPLEPGIQSCLSRQSQGLLWNAL